MTTDAAQPPDPRERKLRPWRWLRLFAGLALGSAFFMPVLPGCHGPIVPAAECRGALEDTRFLLTHIYDLAPLLCIYVAAYFLGVLLAVSAASGLASWRRTAATCDWILAGLLLFVCGTVIVSGIVVFSHGPPTTGGDWLGALLMGPVAIFCLWHAIRGIRIGRGRPYVHRALAAAVTCGWFWTLFLSGLGDAFYGLYLSVASSSLLLLSIVQEARIVAGEDGWRTCLDLARARLQVQDPAGRCLECGYELRGLTEPRCPECGTVFPAMARPLGSLLSSAPLRPNS